MPERFDPIHVDFVLNSQDVKYSSAQIKNDITGTDATVQRSAQKVGETVKRVYDQSVKEVNDYSAAVANASRAQLAHNTRVVASKRYFDSFGHSINQISRELPNFAVSAQIGFLALSNNIPILADEINRLKLRNQELVASGQKGISIWGKIAKSLFGWQTALTIGITLVTLYGRQIGEFFSELFKGKKAVDELINSQESLNKAIEGTDYKNALQDIAELRGNVALAKEGMIDATDVVDQYNKSLGKAAGEAQTLADVEQSLIDNADAYIQMMLYKAAAMESISEASKLVAENQKEQQKVEDDIAAKRKQIEDLNRAPTTEAEAIAKGARNSPHDAASYYGTDSERTKALNAQISDLDAEIAKLEEKQSELSNKGNEVYQKLLRKAAEIAKANGLDLFPGDKKGGSGDPASRRQALLDRLIALDREYARKKLEDDEAEVQALKDKFERIRELVTRFNADPKNKGAQIAMGDIDDVEIRAGANLAQSQEARRLEKIRREAEAARREQEKEWAELLQGLRGYEKKRLDAIAEYQKTREQLIRQGKEAEAAELDAQHQEELAQLDDANVAKMKSYKELFDGTIKLSKDAAAQIIANARKLLETQEMSAEMKAKILREIAEIERYIEETEIDKILKLADALGTLGGSLSEFENSGLSQAGAALSGLAGGMRDLTTVFDSSSSDMDVISAGINGVVRMITMIATAAKKRKEAEEAYYRSMIALQHEYNLGLIEQTRLQSIMEESVFLKDYEGRMTDAFAAMQASSEQYQQALEALNDVQVKLGQKNEIDWGSVGTGASAGAAIGAAVGSIVPVIGTAVGAVVGGIGGAITGLFAGKKKGDVWGSLLGEYPELLEQTADGVWRVNEALAASLIANDLLDEAGKQLVQNALDLQEAYDEAQAQIREVIGELAGSMGNDLRNALVNTFEAGENAALAMGDTVEQVLENIVSNLVFNQVFAEAFARLEQQMAASYDLGGDNSWVDDFGAFFSEAQGLTNDFYEALAAAQAEAEKLGLDLFEGNNKGGLTGAIKRELTEETASELTGLFRATFDLQKNTFDVAYATLENDQQALDATMRIMAHSAAIESNTFNTVVQLKEAVTELRAISKNTKNRGGFDKGI